MTDLLDFRTWTTLQWVLVVLAAGFIGQFGKSFAQFIIAKLKAGRAAGKAATLSLPAERGKIMSKAPAAATGKGDDAAERGFTGQDVRNVGESGMGPAAPSVPDKKALKAILKQQKKATKASK
ncbi:MAG: hypothetical protein QG555_413 [Thermodesulfobacteriota bacterium]|nr:hypothetical protein [Thermodesulfobacteriota bacterium]